MIEIDYVIKLNLFVLNKFQVASKLNGISFGSNIKFIPNINLNKQLTLFAASRPFCFLWIMPAAKVCMRQADRLNNLICPCSGMGVSISTEDEFASPWGVSSSFMAQLRTSEPMQLAS